MAYVILPCTGADTGCYFCAVAVGLFSSHIFFELLPGGLLQGLCLRFFQWSADFLDVIDTGHTFPRWQAILISVVGMSLACVCYGGLGVYFGWWLTAVQKVLFKDYWPKSSHMASTLKPEKQRKCLEKCWRKQAPPLEMR